MDSSSDAYTVAEITQLIDNLRHPEAEVRLQSIQDLCIISRALGAARTRDELLPFLIESIDDEDEVIAVMAEELKKFIPLVGGSAFAHQLLPILEQLSGSEEISIREKATEGLVLVAEVLPANMLHTTFVPLVARLVQGQWYTGKAAACSLFAPIYQKVPMSDRVDLVNFYVALCQDATPMGFLGVLEAEAVDSRFVGVLEYLASDSQDSVRLLAASVCVPMSRYLPSTQAQSVILPIFVKMAKDDSWRVRYMASDSICDLQAILGPAISSSQLLPLLIGLICDSESEVRSVIATKIYQFCKSLRPEVQRDAIVKDILPPLETLVADDSQHVRASVAKVLMPLSALIGKDQIQFHRFITQFLSHCLKFSEVRLNIISHLEEINRVIGIGQLSQSLLPAIHELAADPSWRVRLAMIEYIPLVAKQLGVDFFNEQLSSLCFGWLRDKSLKGHLFWGSMHIHVLVYAVRQAAAQNLKCKLLPGIAELSRDRNHMFRMTYLFAINILITVLGAELIFRDIFPNVAQLSRDPVPNIRFNSALTLEKIFPFLDIRTAATNIFPVLEKLVQDPDMDVKYFSSRAFVALRGVPV